jgi:hypothetical protein
LTKYQVTKTGVQHTQLFNLKENPYEFMKEHHDPRVVAMTGVKPTKNQVNLAKDPKYADKLKEMEALLLAEMRSMDDPYRLWNQPDDGLEVPIIKEKIKKPKKPRKPKNK